MPKEVDPVWDKYMAVSRGPKDLALLLTASDISAQYKDKALQILLTPDFGQLPFAVNPIRETRNFLGDSLGPDRSLRTVLQGEWIVRAAQLVETHISALRSIDPKNSDAIRARYQYQHLIVDLLPVVPSQQAETLFSHFRVDTPAPWDIGSNVSSSYLLRAIYGDPNIDESWKRKVATQVHETIRRNPSVYFAGRWDNHHARGYGSELDTLVLAELADGQFPISRGFFQDEIVFLLSIDTGRSILLLWDTTVETMKLLDDREVRHSFLRRQFLPWDPNAEKPRLIGLQESANTAATSLLTLFPEDTELVNSIQGQLRKTEEQERIIAGQPRSDADAAIIAEMKT